MYVCMYVCKNESMNVYIGVRTEREDIKKNFHIFFTCFVTFTSFLFFSLLCCASLQFQFSSFVYIYKEE